MNQDNDDPFYWLKELSIGLAMAIMAVVMAALIAGIFLL